MLWEQKLTEGEVKAISRVTEVEPVSCHLINNALYLRETSVGCCYHHPPSQLLHIIHTLVQHI